MPLFDPARRTVVEALAAIHYANPFLPERLELERRALGSDYAEVEEPRGPGPYDDAHSNVGRLLKCGEAILESTRASLEAGATATDSELEAYEGIAVFVLYHRWLEQLWVLVARTQEPACDRVEVPWYKAFRTDVQRTLRPGGRRLPLDLKAAHLIALYFQAARAYHNIYTSILGRSAAAGALRAAVWQSLFTLDIRRYHRALYQHMAAVSTLVTGPSGTGKELVARAVGLSSYIEFDDRTRSFAAEPANLFLALNLSALSPTLIESELFGYRRGAFTGAAASRVGWFERCHPEGAVFLDEIAEVAPEIQVKLLRVLQTRTFERVGDSEPREFRGKLISATNRDLAARMASGDFREDLYYRICSDHIVTPSLAEQVSGSMGELHDLALFVARGLVGGEAPALAQEVVAWIGANLGLDYGWPGNFRELEQCVRGVLIRGEYRPDRLPERPVRAELASSYLAGECSAERVLRDYCTLVYARVGSFEGAARQLGLDRRTVKAKLDPELLERLRSGDYPGAPAGPSAGERSPAGR